jgi:phosphoenolpyruvate carboxykinase (GTP)
MLPFCGYNMADYFAHWLSIGKTSEPSKLPKIFHVNWFRKNGNGSFLWPGYGDNIRILKWMFERVSGGNNAVETPVGLIPDIRAIDTGGLNISDSNLKKLLEVNHGEWREETREIAGYFKIFQNL